MAQYDELVSVLRELLTNRFSPLPRYVNALLGDGQGNVVPPDRPDMSYARFTKESTNYFEVFNVTVPKVHNWPVKIGEVPWNPGLTQVVGTNWSAFEQSGWGDVMGDTSPHGPTHEYPDGSPGADVVNIYTRAIVPGRAYLSAAAPTTIYVNAMEYGTTGTLWGGLPGVNLQPLMSAMTTGTMRYAGVYLDSSTNSVGIVTGATTVFTSAFDPPRVPFPATGVIPIARVRVYGGQSSLAEIDVKDARRLFGQGGGANFNDAEGDPEPVGPTAADGTSAYAARRDHIHEGAYLGGSYVTRDTETLDLPNSVALLDGDGFSIDTSTPGELRANLNIEGLTETTTPGDADLVAIFDDSATAHRKITRANFLKGAASTLEVLNTSGAAVAAGDVGYIDSAGEFKTTTTASLIATWAVVLVGGNDNAAVYVARAGSKIMVNYTGTAPNDGEYLVTSTSAGDALASATMQPAVFAICTANGSGGQVEVTLLCNTNTIPVAPDYDIFRVDGASTSDFVATIATLPGGAVLTYSAPSSGAEDVLVPTSTSQHAKMVLHNTTRGNDALISNCVTGTNTITLTANVPAGWTVGDAITARSQTNTNVFGGVGYFLDFELTGGVDTLARAVGGLLALYDAANTPQIYIHPYKAYVSNQAQNYSLMVAAKVAGSNPDPVPIHSKRFCLAWFDTGSSTTTVVFRAFTELRATP